jgi:hypothetical protein
LLDPLHVDREHEFEDLALALRQRTVRLADIFLP